MIISEKHPIAIKEHKCSACLNIIGKGEKYHRRFGGFDRTELHERICCDQCYKDMVEIEKAYLLDIYDIEAENDYCQSDAQNY